MSCNELLVTDVDLCVCVCFNAPLAAVSWPLSKQRDWLSQGSEAGLHLSVISGDGDLSCSAPALKRSESFLLPLADSLLHLQSLSCMASWEIESHTHTHRRVHILL